MLSDQRKRLFFLIEQTFLLLFRWFNCLAEILLIFGRNKLCPLFVNFAIGHNTFLPFMTDEKRQGAACRKGFRQICFLPLFCVPTILSKVWISARQFSVLFSFGIFLFLEAVVKAALFVVGEVGAIQVVINPSPVYLRHLRLV